MVRIAFFENRYVIIWYFSKDEKTIMIVDTCMFPSATNVEME